MAFSSCFFLVGRFYSSIQQADKDNLSSCSLPCSNTISVCQVNGQAAKNPLNNTRSRGKERKKTHAPSVTSYRRTLAHAVLVAVFRLSLRSFPTYLALFRWWSPVPPPRPRPATPPLRPVDIHSAFAPLLLSLIAHAWLGFCCECTPRLFPSVCLLSVFL
jgi:hypothetical protein